MAIRFILLVNKQGQTRLAQYYEYLTLDERRALEGEIVRKCLARSENQCSFVEHRNYKVIYRRYASLFFLVGVDEDENELAILEFIHLVVETMDRHFGNVCELDIMFHLEKAHFMLEEMLHRDEGLVLIGEIRWFLHCNLNLKCKFRNVIVAKCLHFCGKFKCSN
ncbi:hypothetical protein SUGI_0582920 [Cryptomeria japonica]|nr:hypothetical protein SUGI_0582920 [Cryptomeria japonica]